MTRETGRGEERAANGAKQRPEVDYVEAEHDPVASRRASDAAIQRMLGPRIQRKAIDSAAPSSNTAGVERAASESGAPLPADVRGRFEQSLGTDLSGVRVHTGSASAAAADGVSAKAYATGQDIHFAAGQYDPASKEGQRLLAHEVAHTVQQGNSHAGPQAKLEISGPADSHEHEADQAANAMVTGAPAVVSRVGAGMVQRKALGETDEQANMDAAAQPIKAKVPEAQARGKSVPISTDHAPTVDEVFDPQRPALDGATNEVVMKRIEGLVTIMYEKILDPELSALQAKLGQARPVPETPFALKLLGWAVEQIMSHTLSYVGGFVGKQLFAGEPATETTIAVGGTESEPIVSTVTKQGSAPAPNWKEKAAEKAGDIAGEKGSSALKEKMLERPTTAPSPDEQVPSMTTADLLQEFISRERLMLYARQSDVLTRLTMTHAKTAPSDVASPEFVALADKLRNLLESGALKEWFRNRVTMEWLNFMTRVSLGPRPAGQTTELTGANTIGGIPSGDTEARREWVGADGMVEIRLKVPDVVHGANGLALQRAEIPSSFGAAEILHRIRAQTHSLATLPVYRRVWLQTGDSKLTESPAFVITPEGAIEADMNNPVLAVIGSQLPMNVGESTYTVGTTRRGDEARWSPGVTATYCRTGAQLVRDMLRGISPEVLK